MTSRIILDVHALQSVPPSNLNRDDTGAPKTAVYGGATRARVSSQAWKRATRRYFDTLLDPGELGVRTKRVAELLAERITELAPHTGEAQALALAAEVLQTATGSKIEPPKRKVEQAKKNGGDDPAPESSYLMFLSARQLDLLAALAVEGAADIKAFFKDKDAKARAKKIADGRHSVDIALFGRMVADSTDINVDAAAQVAHAIGVHRSETESDYFTAVDDRNTDAEPGAGMIGTVDFNSATLYRYAALDVDLLERNLGKGLDEQESPATPVRRAVEAFVEGFVSSLPTGKINTFGNHTLPDAVLVTLRTSRPVSFVGAFEKPVTPDTDGGHLEPACARLADYVPEIERAYGDDSSQTWVLRVGPATAKLSSLGQETPRLSTLVTTVGAAVAARLEERG
ncbi:type I-E CRISPR-associated protein Cas7/Cse4/CasC [Kitasatospora sp. YST-16]|uniref:type I-E CRISPR-associated protein Cas7/Cse4/CasC n=1 Tax=Kitasatospora sp. YST-16 TaxID=2998080 RepID=UPI002284DC3B|nr:type I-E CRISPR-associated protein Cas7/Cse4/CasC [Kitasatospora sp. YST-16]WAL70485.1 type I-E CRISPR-associated protein Cas7/Cse4/CasC [Kitasatospora sp. YST-16]WNW36524.1 type I-E CRISPR-associated protein Cas7/Cse4/CasC [Streptomyces sp. Li-HN-5-13]